MITAVYESDTTPGHRALVREAQLAGATVEDFVLKFGQAWEALGHALAHSLVYDNSGCLPVEFHGKVSLEYEASVVRVELQAPVCDGP